jgi:hypothetical protein
MVAGNGGRVERLLKDARDQRIEQVILSGRSYSRVQTAALAPTTSGRVSIFRLRP